MAILTVTSKGRITIPASVRQQMGIRQGCRLKFSLAGHRIEMRVVKPVIRFDSGFGMLRSDKRAVPADFKTALIYRPIKK